MIAIVREFPQPPTDPAEQQRWQKAIESAVNPMSDAIIAYSRAAERYIYCREPVGWTRRVLNALHRQGRALPGD